MVFFSFDYDDVWLVNQVRNSGKFVGERRSGFRDKAEYEQVKRRGDAAIKRWIRGQMQGCSVTCVLIVLIGAQQTPPPAEVARGGSGALSERGRRESAAPPGAATGTPGAGVGELSCDGRSAVLHTRTHGAAANAA